MIIIGLTGSIGMGKTAVAAMFADLGAIVHGADDEVRRLLQKGGEGAKAVEKLFPPEDFPQIYEEGHINRTALGALVFADEILRENLENALHPLVREERKEFLERNKNRRSKIVVFDIPLLFETGAEEECDITIVVSAPENIQRERVLARPSMTEEKFRAILARQMPDAEKRSKADYVIDTGLSLEETQAQVVAVLQKLQHR